jgi:hypothetical protein
MRLICRLVLSNGDVADVKRRIRNANHASLPAGVGGGLLLVRLCPDYWFWPPIIGIHRSHLTPYGQGALPCMGWRERVRDLGLEKLDVELHVQNNATATATPSRQRRSDDTAAARHR